MQVLIIIEHDETLYIVNQIQIPKILFLSQNFIACIKLESKMSELQIGQLKYIKY